MAAAAALIAASPAIAEAPTAAALELSAEQLDQITAGAAAAAAANGRAAGQGARTDARTRTRARPRRARGAARGKAVGTDAAFAAAGLSVMSDYLEAGVEGAALAPEGGRAKTVARGFVKEKRRRDVAVLRVRSVARGDGAIVDTAGYVVASEEAKIRVRTRTFERNGRTVERTVLRVVAPRGG